MTPITLAEALFVSVLQPSDEPDQAMVSEAIATSLLRHGGQPGCVADLAAEYGEHPETAAVRMRWALAHASSGSEAALQP